MKLLGSDQGNDDMKRICQRLMRAALRSRTCQLTLLGLALMGSGTGLSPKESIDTDWRDDLTVISAKQDLRVEFTDFETPVAIANADNSRQQLANANPGDTSKGNTYGSEVFISPDSRWILQITWRVHTNREKRLIDAFLYQVTQIAPLHLQRYPARESFGDLAMSRFHVPDDSYADIHFVEWKPDALVMAFTVRPDVEPHVGDDGVDWQYEFDLRKHTFTNPVRMAGPSRLIDD